MLKIALMGDLHYPAVSSEDNAALEKARDRFFQAYFEAFLAMEADYHISIGDITHTGIEEEFAAVDRYVRDGSRNFRFVLGNHDSLAHPKSELLLYTGQPRYHAVETEEALLIFLDTTKELDLHGWGLDGEQWDWLSEQMKRSPDKTAILFAHHPVAGTTSSSPDPVSPFEPFQDIRPILKLRQGSGFYFNGHTHTHSIIEKDGWHFIQTSAVLCHPSFRLMELDGDRVHIKTIETNDESLLENRRYLYDGLRGFHRPSGSIYESKDLDYSVRLK